MSIPLYFNKTLLHKSFKWSSLISDPAWRSSPPKVTICSVAHGLQLQPFSRFWVLWSKTPLGNCQNHIRWVWNTLWTQKANNVNMLMVRTLLPFQVQIQKANNVNLLIVRTLLPFQVQSKSCLKVPVYSCPKCLTNSSIHPSTSLLKRKHWLCKGSRRAGLRSWWDRLHVCYMNIYVESK